MAGENPGDVRSRQRRRVLLQEHPAAAPHRERGRDHERDHRVRVLHRGLPGRPAQASPRWWARSSRAPLPGKRACARATACVEVNGHALASFTDLRMEAAFLPRDEEARSWWTASGKPRTAPREGALLGRGRASSTWASGRPSALVRGRGRRTRCASGPRDVVDGRRRSRVRRCRGGRPHRGGARGRSRRPWKCGRPTAAPGLRSASGAATPDEKPSGDPRRKVGHPRRSVRPSCESARGAAAGLEPGDVLDGAARRRAAPRGGRGVRLASAAGGRTGARRVRRARGGTATVMVPVPGVTDRAAVTRAPRARSRSVPPATVVAACRAGTSPLGRIDLSSAPDLARRGASRKGDRIVSDRRRRT